jgi:hypothetical protein
VPWTPEDLRLRIGFPAESWSPFDDERAEAILASARSVILTFVDPDKLQDAIDTNNLVVLGAVDQATMIYAVPLFGNPERKLQQRQGADYSTSWADSVMAATGLEEALKILDDADLRKKAGNAFSVDTVNTNPLQLHAETCALVFGANYCDCGAIYAGYPIFGPSA